MSITVVARKLLWGRAGNRCAWAGCNQQLTVDLSDPEAQVLAGQGAVIGQEAHIRSGKADGPRHDPNYEQVDSYDNLVLLCPTHHDVIDKNDGGAWSVEAILGMKQNHETAVFAALAPKQASALMLDERLTAAVQIWADDLLGWWSSFTWASLSAYPRLREDFLEALTRQTERLLKKNWPASHPRLALAFNHWRDVASELVRHVHDTFEHEQGRDRTLRLIPGHKQMGRVDAAEYDKRFSEFLMAGAVLGWLVYELTRATNLVIAAVRLDLDPLYRFEEGLVLISVGDLVSGQTLIRVEYDGFDWENGREVPSRGQIAAAIKAEHDERGFFRYDEVNVADLLL